MVMDVKSGAGPELADLIGEFIKLGEVTWRPGRLCSGCNDHVTVAKLGSGREANSLALRQASLVFEV
jgi:hypothetical protein